MRRYLILGVLPVLLFSAAAEEANAEMPEVAVGVKASTLGFGGDIIAKATDHFNVRLGLQGFTYDITETESDIEYDADIDLLSGLVLADWFPFSSGFRLSAGVLVNNNEVSARGKAQSGMTFNIGGTTFDADQVGDLDAEVDFETFAPYVGIGWGNPVKKDSGWSFFFDLGVAYHGSPNVEITANGPLAGNAAFQSALARERAELEDEIDDFKYYPVLSLGVSYNF